MNFTRQDYLQALDSELEKNIVYHSLSLEACLGAIYDYLDQNKLLKKDEAPKQDWLLAGLLHDIDYGSDTKTDHLKKTKQVLAKHKLDISNTVHQIILAHGPHISGVQPQSQAQWAIFCADSLTGLIVAVALVYP
ncbi:HD domain-containing protein, partial [Patescibacteria group bacterium]|nr:HD domain-containing protein [Patescibacteria group bacterium]